MDRARRAHPVASAVVEEARWKRERARHLKSLRQARPVVSSHQRGRGDVRGGTVRDRSRSRGGSKRSYLQDMRQREIERGNEKLLNRILSDRRAKDRSRKAAQNAAPYTRSRTEGQRVREQARIHEENLRLLGRLNGARAVLDRKAWQRHTMENERFMVNACQKPVVLHIKPVRASAPALPMLDSAANEEVEQLVDDDFVPPGLLDA